MPDARADHRHAVGFPGVVGDGSRELARHQIEEHPLHVPRPVGPCHGVEAAGGVGAVDLLDAAAAAEDKVSPVGGSWRPFSQLLEVSVLTGGVIME